MSEDRKDTNGAGATPPGGVPKETLEAALRRPGAPHEGDADDLHFGAKPEDGEAASKADDAAKRAAAGWSGRQE